MTASKSQRTAQHQPEHAARRQSPPIFFLMGPTASGKTALAMHLAQRLPLQLINVDSVMVYRGMNIGSAKPSAAELHQAPHLLLDVCPPDQAFSAGDYYHLVLAAIRQVQAAGRVPLCVGGSMLYFNLLRRGLAPLPTADPALRAEYAQRLAQHGPGALYAQLQKVDAESAARLNMADTKRVIRALEINQLSGKTVAQLQQATRPPLAGEYYSMAIMPSARRDLDATLEARIKSMLQQGLVAEVQQLLQKWPAAAALPAMRAVGYRQVMAYLQGDIARQSLPAAILTATVRLVKHQMTWLRTWPLDLTLPWQPALPGAAGLSPQSDEQFTVSFEFMRQRIASAKVEVSI